MRFSLFSLIAFGFTNFFGNVFAEPRAEPPSGCLVVRASAQSGEHSSLADALSALGTSTDPACVFIYDGIYDAEDATRIEYPGPLTLYGYTEDTGRQSANTVTLRRKMDSTTAGNLDESSVVNIVCADFAAYNINFHNTYGAGRQAVSVTANGDRQGYYACGFYGYQDTLYAKSGAQYYSNCHIEGAVDYIFGAAAAWFGECTVASNGEGYITANSRNSANDTTWYIFDHCRIIAAAGSSLTEQVYLGRPWRQYARVMYQDSQLSDVVHPEGWTTMAEEAVPVYQEWNNSGEGSDTSQRLHETPAEGPVSRESLWGGSDNWIDKSW